MSYLFAVDGALCISLVERGDRRTLLREQFARMHLEVEFLLVERDVQDPQRGCFHSHQRCARLLLERGWQRALVLEDDVLFYDVGVQQVKQINAYLRRGNPPVFYLGLILGKLWPTWRRGVVGCRAQGTHAYVLNREAAGIVVAEDYHGQGIDTFLKRRLPGRAAYPMLCQQQPESVGKSDLDSGRWPGFVKDEAFWQRNRDKQYREWWQSLFLLLTPRSWG